MKLTLPAIALASSLLLLAGCAREEPSEAPANAPAADAEGAPVEQPGMDSPADVSPVNAQTWLDDFTIGSKLNADGSIEAGNTGDDFSPGQTVYIAMETNDAPANTPVKVIWYGPNETKIAEETKNVSTGQKYLNFSAANTKSWAKGDYRAEVWVGDEKVNQQMFQIVDADEAAS